MICSFDVFDTCLTRRIGCPATVFLLLGFKAKEQGLISSTPAAFRSMRIFAEQQARELDPAREPTLIDIHQQLAGLLELSTGASSLLLKLELEIETDVMIAVPGMREYVESIRESGVKIVFISDMYLPPDFLRKLLSGHRFLNPEDSVYVSCEQKLSKRDGNLFKRVLTSENIHANNVRHVGNDPVADFAAPKMLGISSEHRTEGNLNHYENVMETYAVDTDGLSSLFAGASRLARLDLIQKWKEIEPIKDVSCGVVGPVLCSFVLWLLQRAKSRGIKRLYFLSRDGYILHQIAMRLLPSVGFDLDLRYLYGSRQAWHSAGLKEISISDQEWILDQADHATLTSVLKRLNLAPEEIKDQLMLAGFSESTWTHDLRKKDYATIWSVITTNVTVRELILTKAASARQIALRYFQQEHMLDGNSFAIVDLGWHGRLEMSLRRILGDAAPSFAGGFYFGFHQNAVPEVAAKADTFLFGAGKPQSKIPCLAPMLEIFCTAPHATLAGYTVRDERVEPVFRPGHEEKIQQWGIEALHSSVIRFSERIAETLERKHSEIPMREMVLKLLDLFSTTPSIDEAKAWGSFPYEDGQTGDGFSTFLMKPTPEIRSLLLASYYGSAGFLFFPIPRVFWNGGAEVLAKADPMLKFALRLGRLNAKLRHRLKSLFH
jgi:predicted HAD superfamily hydrolase